MKDSKKGAFDVHCDNRSRKQHLDVISYYGKIGRSDLATEYWLKYTHRISFNAYQKAYNGH